MAVRRHSGVQEEILCNVQDSLGEHRDNFDLPGVAWDSEELLTM